MPRKTAWTVLLLGMLAAIAWMLGRGEEPTLVANVPAGTGEPAPDPAAANDQRVAVPTVPTVPPLRTEAATTRGGLRVTVRWKHDDRPAPDVAIEIARGDGFEAGAFQPAGTTDAAGELRLADLEPGWLAVRPQFVERPRWCDIDAGGAAELAFELDARTVVTGTVVDRGDHPVGGAAVWLSETKRSSTGEVVARTDAGGQFTAEFVGEGRFVAARAAGCGISAPVAVLPEPRAPVSVRVVLDQEAARVLGEVVDGDGRPVPDASVVIGEFRELGGAAILVMELQGEAWMPLVPPPVRVRTDRGGRFVAAACPAGRVPVMAWAPGFGLWSERTAIAAGDDNRLRIEFLPEAVVSGQVRDAAGRSVAGAEVRARPAGPVPSREAWPHWRVRAGPTGSFAFANLPAGEVRLEVEHREHGKAQATLPLAPGQHRRWDPVLAVGLCLRARVVDGDGRALRGFRVSVSGRGETGEGRRRRRLRDTRHGRTDAMGRVVFASCLDVPYDLHATAIDGLLAWPAVRVEDVPPGGDETVLQVEGFAPAAAFLRGHVQDSQGGAIGSTAELSFKRQLADSGGSRGDFPLPGKPFRIGPLHDGIYQLRLKVADCAPITIRDLVVEGGRDLDLGTLIAEPSGKVTATIVGAGGEPCGSDRVWLVRAGRVEEQLATEPGAPVTFDDVAAGDYVLTASSDALGMCTERVVVPVGGECEATLRLDGGVPCTFELRIPSLAFGMADLRWLDANGDLIGKERFAQRSQTSGSLRRTLPVGRYRLELRGLLKPAVGAVDFAVTDPMPAPVLLDVREVTRDEWRRWPR